MNDRDRLKQLRTLRDHLNRLPPSAERDRMLREVGSRAVDLESSEPKSHLRPLSAEPDVPVATVAPQPKPQPVIPAAPVVQRAAPQEPPRPARRTPSATRRPSTRGEAGRVRARAAAADDFIASVRPTPALPEGLLLSLSDEVATPVEASRERPWTRGLRG
jgi:hypothetical protein